MLNEKELLKQLSIAIVETPRATTKELAEAVGISKATLHRFCGTRENLEKMIGTVMKEGLDAIIQVAEQECDDYKAGLRELIKAHFAQKEMLKYCLYMQDGITDEDWETYQESLDAFFLRGQKNGVFKIDLAGTFLADGFTTMICTAVDSERRGRTAPHGLEEMVELFFLKGAEN